MKRYCEMTRCLIVDEDKEWRGRAQGYLADQGFDTEEADTETLAYEKYMFEKPDVVLVGTRNASAFIRQLRRHSEGKEPIVILCPEKSDLASVGEAIWHGASDYMVKPFNGDILAAKLRQTGLLQNR